MVKVAGAVIVPREREGMPEETLVEVLLYDEDPPEDRPSGSASA